MGEWRKSDERTPLITGGAAPESSPRTRKSPPSSSWWVVGVVCALVACLGVAAVAMFGGSSVGFPGRYGDFEHKKYILVSLGRSGSTPTFAAIDKLTHGEMRPLDKTMLYEILGSNVHAMTRRTDPDRKTRRFFEKKFMEHPSTPTAGFKWKPLVDNEHYDRTWKWCAKNNVKFIVMTRNPLDMVISETKHHENPHLNPHCHGTHCVEAHAVKVTLPLGEDLETKMGHLQKHYDMVRRKCVSMHAKCMDVSYERLFASDKQEQLKAWREVIAFIQDEAHAHLITEEYVKFALASSMDTSPGDRSTYVANWPEVENSVRHSLFAKTLHCSTDELPTEKEGCSLPTTDEPKPWDSEEDDGRSWSKALESTGFEKSDAR